MMATKKTTGKRKLTQLSFLKLENVESGSALRANLMKILFRAMAETCRGQFQESKNALSVMAECDMGSPDNTTRAHKECVTRIDYADFYSEEKLIEKSHKLAKLCEEYGCKITPAVILSEGNRLGMESELFCWEWEI